MSFNPDNMKVTSGRDSSYKSSDVKGRPTSDPGRKDFKKVLEKTSDDDEENLSAEDIAEETDGIIAALQSGATKKKPGSLFDLTSNKTSAFDENRPVRTHHEEKAVESPADIYGKLTASDGKKVTKNTNVGAEDKVDTLDVDEDKDEKVDFDTDLPVAPVKPNYTTRYSTEQTDISYVNPLASVSQPSINLNISTEKAVVPVSNIQEIINQMIEKVTEMKNTGSTETVVTLKQPPMFEGVKIVVTAFDSAKNEFNITIENLTQAGKQLMDQQSNRNNLLLGLEQKGYAVHILTTTTLTETRVADALPQDGQQQGRQQRDQQEGRQKGQQGQT